MTASRALGAGALDLLRGWRAMQGRVPAAAAGACCALEGGFVAALAAGDRGNRGAELPRNRDVAPGAGRGPQGRAREAAAWTADSAPEGPALPRSRDVTPGAGGEWGLAAPEGGAGCPEGGLTPVAPSAPSTCAEACPALEEELEAALGAGN